VSLSGSQAGSRGTGGAFRELTDKQSVEMSDGSAADSDALCAAPRGRFPFK